MSSPLIGGDVTIAADLVNAGRSGSDVVLVHLGDSIPNASWQFDPRVWRPYRLSGVFTRGAYSLNRGGAGGGFGTDAGPQCGDASTLPGVSKMNYSMFHPREIVFNGTTSGADNAGLWFTNRWEDGSEGAWNSAAGDGTARNLFMFGGVDPFAGQLPTITPIYYVDNVNTASAVRTRLVDGTTNAKLCTSTNPVVSTTRGKVVAMPTVTATVAANSASFLEMVVAVPESTTITSGKYASYCGCIVRWTTQPGLVIVQATQGGMSCDHFNDTNYYTANSVADSLTAVGATHVMVTLIQNGNAGDYTTALRAVIAKLRTASPNIKIILATTWDSSSSPSDLVTLNANNDANYAVATSTTGVLFINGLATLGSRAQNVAFGYATGSDVHPTNDQARCLMAQTWWGLIELAAGSVPAANVRYGTPIIGGSGICRVPNYWEVASTVLVDVPVAPGGVGVLLVPGIADVRAGINYGQDDSPTGLNYNLTGTLVPPPATSSSQSVGQTYTYDQHDNAQAGAVIEYELYSNGTAGRSYPRNVQQVTSDSNGLVQIVLRRGAVYRFRRDSGEWAVPYYTVPDASTCVLPEVLGRAS